MATESSNWFLKKHNEDVVFGPAKLDNLRDWAMAAKISPLDRVSSDRQKTWDRAPMVPSLHMDWLVEVSKDFLYGPTTIGTIQEFIANGEIDESTTVINCVDRTQCLIRDNPVFKNAPRKSLVTLPSSVPQAPDALPVDASPIDMQKRILELEALILKQKRTIEDLQRRHKILRDRFKSRTGENP